MKSFKHWTKHFRNLAEIKVNSKRKTIQHIIFLGRKIQGFEITPRSYTNMDLQYTVIVMFSAYKGNIVRVIRVFIAVFD